MASAKKKRAPAEGEVNARKGYGAQDRVAASDVLDCLWNPEFEELRLVDPLAGATDDYVLVFSNQVIGNSVKWSDSGAHNWGKFLAWLKDLSSGWIALKKQFPGKEIEVRLKINGGWSSATHGNQKFPNLSVADFVLNSWSTRSRISGEVWSAIKKCTSLSPKELKLFINSCSFDMELELETGFQEAPRNRELEQLRCLIEKQIFEKRGSLTVLDLKLALSAPKPFEQVYPEPEFGYVVPESEARLADVLDITNQGYLAIIGPAGSGKSTLVSRVIKERDQSIPYFVYLPGDIAGPIGRADPLGFFRSVIAMLDQQLPASRNSHSIKTIPEALGALKRLFAAAESRYRQTGAVTTFFIDGLDHIERTPLSVSFINHLPLPSAIPEGCVIVLSSRPSGIHLLPAEVRTQLRSRTIEIAPLESSKILDKLLKAEWLDQDSAVALSSSCNGNPLVLTHMLRACFHHPDRDVTELLTEQKAWSSIEDYYDQTIGFLMDDRDLSRFLALVCRVESPEVEWLRAWDCFGSRSFDTVYNKVLSAFFRVELTHLVPVHESLIYFLRKRSLPQIPGSNPEEAEREFHLCLAAFCELLSERKRDEYRIRHLYLAGEYYRVASFVSRHWYDAARARFCPPQELKAICEMAIYSAVEDDDIDALVRVLPLCYDNESREYTISSEEMAALFLKIGMPNLAFDYLCGDLGLRVKPPVALKFITRFLEEPTEQYPASVHARKLFEFATPRTLLAGLEEIRDHDCGSLARWFRVAPYFHTKDEVVRFYSQLRFGQRHQHFSAAERIQLSILDGLLSFEKPEGSVYAEELLQSETVELRLWTLQRKEAFFETDETDHYVALVPGADDNPLENPSQVLWLASLLAERGRIEPARVLVRQVNFPDLFIQGDDFGLCIRYLYLVELLNIVNGPFRWRTEFDESDARLLTAFQTLGSALALTPESLGCSELAESFRKALSYESIPVGGALLGRHKFRLGLAKRAIHSACLKLAEKQGSRGFSALVETYRKLRHNSSAFNPYFSSRMAFRLWQLQAIHRSEVLDELKICEGRLSELSARENAEEKIRLIRLYNRLGEDTKVAVLLESLPTNLSAVQDEKDPQMLHWINWATSDLDDSNAVGRLSLLGTALELVGGSHGVEAAEDIVENCFLRLPQQVSDFGIHLVSRGEVGFGFEAFLESLTYAISERDPHLAAQMFSGFVARLSASASRCAKKVATSLSATSDNRSALELLNVLFREGYRSGLRGQLKDLRIHLTTLDCEVPASLIERELAQNSRSTGSDSYTSSAGVFSPESLAETLGDSSQVLSFETYKSSETYYKWKDTLKQIRSVDRERFAFIERLVEASWSSASGRVALAELAERSGLVPEAIRLAQSILESAEPWGWFEQYDGGSRVSAYELLIRINGEKARKDAKNFFLIDIKSRFPPIDWLMFDLRSICEFFGWDWPSCSASESASAYLRDKLRPFEERAETQAFPSIPSGKSNDWESSIVSIFVRFLDSPFGELVSPSADCLDWILAHRPDTFFRKALVQSLETETDVRVEKLLTVILAGVQSSKVPKLEDFAEVIPALYSSSRSLAVTRLCRKICLLASWAYARDSSLLPTTYRLSVKLNPIPTEFQLMAGELENSPIGMTMMIFSRWLQVIGHETGIDEETLLYRAETLYKQEKNSFFWADGCERFTEKWKGALKSSDETFTKPQYLVARHAVMLLLQELVDSGTLNEDLIPDAGNLHPLLDPVFVGEAPRSKPNEIVVYQEREDLEDTWMADPLGKGIPPMVSCRALDSVVIAERTLLRSNFWNRLTESRSWGISPRMHEESIEDIPRLSSFRYHHGLSQHEESAMMVASLNLPSFRSCLGWLAVHPKIARKLKWVRGDSGLFRYIDSEKAVMVETIWWRQGWCYRRSPIQDGFTAEGWLVLASPKGWAQLSETFTELYGVGELERSQFDTDRGMTERMSWPIKFRMNPDLPWGPIGDQPAKTAHDPT